MDKCSVSIVIPVYNAEEFLERCMGSIVAQDYRSYEVIAVDDGSSDSSGLICDRYSATDSRFRTIHKKNGGVSSARNAGMNMAKGEFLLFVDADDALPPGALTALVEAAQAGADFVLGGFTKVYDNGLRDERRMSGRAFPKGEMSAFLDENIVRNGELLNTPWGKLFRRSVIVGNDLQFNEKLSYGEDKLFVDSYLLCIETAATLCQPIYDYYIRPGSLGSDVRSDRHVIQLMYLLPLYADIISRYEERFPDSKAVAGLYHNDLIGRFVFRILNIFTLRKTGTLTADNLRTVYGLMDKDRSMGVFGVRTGQMVNVMLYEIGSVKLSMAYYRFTSSVFSLFSVFSRRR